MGHRDRDKVYNNLRVAIPGTSGEKWRFKKFSFRSERPVMYICWFLTCLNIFYKFSGVYNCKINFEQQ